MLCFVSIDLYVKNGDDWSKPIFGLGGSKLIADEKGGLHSNDEGFKMALTDALSVAMKELGVAAAIYQGLWDGSKYIDLVEAVSTTEIESWSRRCEKASNASAEKFAPWWKTYGEQIKKECGKAGAAVVYEMYQTYLARLKAEANDSA